MKDQPLSNHFSPNKTTMKSILIVLLFAAAGTAVYFFFFKKKNETGKEAFRKEWLTGTWKPVKSDDSTAMKYKVEFLKEGKIIRIPLDSSGADTSYFDWKNENALLFKEKPADSTGKLYSVVQLTKDSLSINTEDKKNIVLEKVK
jgi:hypothetical protein